jgi:hypothetical protein
MLFFQITAYNLFLLSDVVSDRIIFRNHNSHIQFVSKMKICNIYIGFTILANNTKILLSTAQRQALQARRASRRHELCHYTAFLRRRSEGSETGGVIFCRQLSRRLQAHVRRHN